jgi:hypothetical protein
MQIQVIWDLEHLVNIVGAKSTISHQQVEISKAVFQSGNIVMIVMMTNLAKTIVQAIVLRIYATRQVSDKKCMISRLV